MLTVSKVIATTALTITLLLSLGCAEAATPGPVVVRDSAGVRVIENGQLDDRVAFRADPEYVSGWTADGPTFEYIASGALLPNGRAAIGDGGSRTILILSPSGATESVIGGVGSGPGEIGVLGSVSPVEGDTILVEDDGNHRFAYVEDRAILRTFSPVNPMLVARFTGIGLLGGDHLVMISSIFPVEFDEPWFQGEIVTLNLQTEKADTIRQFDLAPNPARDPDNPFRPFGKAAVVQSGIAVGRGDRSQIELIDSAGRTTRIVRWNERRRPVTDSVWTVFENAVRENSGRMAEAMIAERLARWKSGANAPLPYFGSVHGDHDGNLWISEYTVGGTPERRYRVFSPNGEWLGWVEMPPGFRLLDVGSDRVLGVQRNELGVEAISIYRFRVVDNQN